MATLNLALDPKRDAGLSITAFVYSDAGIEQSSVEMTEVGNGIYSSSLDVSSYSDGDYSVLFVNSKRRKGHGKLYVRGGQEVSQYEFEKKSEADTRQTALVAEHDDTQATLATLETKAQADTRQTALVAEIDANEAKIDLLETKAQADTRQTALLTELQAVETGLTLEHDTTQAAIAALKDFDPVTDTVARVTLVDTTTANTDMRGTDNALLASSYIAPDNTGIANGLAQATLARKHLTNRDRIDSGVNTLTRYDDDGTTPLVVFDLKDQNGAGSSESVYEKDPQ